MKKLYAKKEKGSILIYEARQGPCRKTKEQEELPGNGNDGTIQVS